MHYFTMWTRHSRNKVVHPLFKYLARNQMWISTHVKVILVAMMISLIKKQIKWTYLLNEGFSHHQKLKSKKLIKQVGH